MEQNENIFTSEMTQTLQKEKAELIRQAVDLLRQAGVLVFFQANPNFIKVISDTCKVTWDDDKGCSFEIDGIDLTDRLGSLMIQISRGNFPVIKTAFRPKKRNRTINDIEHPTRRNHMRTFNVPGYHGGPRTRGCTGSSQEPTS